MRFDHAQIGDVIVYGRGQYGGAITDTLVLEKKSLTSAYVLNAVTLERVAKHVFPMRRSAIVWVVSRER